MNLPDRGPKPWPWDSPNTALVVKSAGKTAQQISGILGLESGVNAQPGVIPGSGDTLWKLVFDDNDFPEVEQQILALADLVARRKENLRTLRASGCDVEVEITGTVETGCSLRLSTTALEALKGLAIPVSFTVIPAPGVEVGDDLDWLDAPTD